MIDTSPQLFDSSRAGDRATELLRFLGNVIVNGNPHAQGLQARRRARSRPLPGWDRKPGTKKARATCCSNSARRNSPSGR
jgi:pyruvate carboxylase